MEQKKRRFAVLTGGGDCPGLNAVIRAVVKTFLQNDCEVYGVLNGFNGLINDNLKLMDYAAVSGILPRGGTILGTTNRDNPFHFAVEENGELVYKDMREKVIENLRKYDIEALVVIGGDGSLNIGAELARECDIKVVGVPKTIDNDLPCTERTFGFDTAMAMATEALDRLHTTAESHHRVMVLEVMGRYAGWIALHSGIAGGADVILLPEIPYKLEPVIAKIQARKAAGKNFSIVVVAEGAIPQGGTITVQNVRNNGAGVDNNKLGGVGQVVAKQLEELTGLEARNTTLGYMQRGGSPTSFDRVLSTKYGAKAMELALAGKFNVLTVIKDGKLNSVPLEDVVGNNKRIGAVSGNTPESNIRRVNLDNDLVKTARDIGINLGD